VASRDDDFLGDDPHGSWARGVALLDEAIAGLDSLDTTISFLLPLPAREVLLVRVFEAAVHTWDVSRAIGFDERIDERLATLTYPLLERLIQVPATQAFFAPPQDTLPRTATPQDRLLHLSGRQPQGELGSSLHTPTKIDSQSGGSVPVVLTPTTPQRLAGGTSWPVPAARSFRWWTTPGIRSTR
jgi:hypothetical protein